eukprot:3668613-Rhodomonas_salina.2
MPESASCGPLRVNPHVPVVKAQVTVVKEHVTVVKAHEPVVKAARRTGQWSTCKDGESSRKGAVQLDMERPSRSSVAFHGRDFQGQFASRAR